jgi:hypothetical protein
VDARDAAILEIQLPGSCRGGGQGRARGRGGRDRGHTCSETPAQRRVQQLPGGRRRRPAAARGADRLREVAQQLEVHALQADRQRRQVQVQLLKAQHAPRARAPQRAQHAHRRRRVAPAAAAARAATAAGAQPLG